MLQPPTKGIDDDLIFSWWLTAKWQGKRIPKSQGRMNKNTTRDCMSSKEREKNQKKQTALKKRDVRVKIPAYKSTETSIKCCIAGGRVIWLAHTTDQWETTCTETAKLWEEESLNAIYRHGRTTRHRCCSACFCWYCCLISLSLKAVCFFAVNCVYR